MDIVKFKLFQYKYHNFQGKIEGTHYIDLSNVFFLLLLFYFYELIFGLYI